MKRTSPMIDIHRGCMLFLLLAGLTLIFPFSVAMAAEVYKESGGMLSIEAENYHAKKNTSTCNFYQFPTGSSTPKPDPDAPHKSGVSGGRYLEILPDSRATAKDPLKKNLNFFESGAKAPQLHYNVRISNAGRYYIWIRAFSTGTEDNSIHVGVDGKWPGSGTSVQWCSGKNSWTWSSARRLQSNHCGKSNGAYLDLSSGNHTIMLGMREDGFEFDRLIFTKNSKFTPSNTGPIESQVTEREDESGQSNDNSSSVVSNQSSSGNGTDTSEESQSIISDQNLVVIEAENFNNNVQTKSHYWNEVTSPGNYSGNGAMKAFPDKGSRFSTNYSSQSPSLKFTVDFRLTGKHYIWVRGYARGDDNSLHAGLNGKASDTSQNISIPAQQKWVWNDQSTNGKAYLSVSKKGKQTVDIWMREDGLVLDKILLTTNKSYVPKQTGPSGTSLQIEDSSSSFANSSQNTEAKDLLVIEAESFNDIKNQGKHSWKESTSYNGYSADGAMCCLPDTNSRFNSGYSQKSPYLNFKASFAQPGKYYIWLRGRAVKDGNSVHVGIDGNETSSGRNVIFKKMGGWSWTGELSNGAPAFLNLTKSGVHTIQVWMREDGLTLDKILLSTDPSYVPSGLGPQENN